MHFYEGLVGFCVTALRSYMLRLLALAASTHWPQDVIPIEATHAGWYALCIASCTADRRPNHRNEKRKAESVCVANIRHGCVLHGTACVAPLAVGQ